VYDTPNSQEVAITVGGGLEESGHRRAGDEHWCRSRAEISSPGWGFFNSAGSGRAATTLTMS
jgi:hypothetical protein